MTVIDPILLPKQLRHHAIRNLTRLLIRDGSDFASIMAGFYGGPVFTEISDAAERDL